MKGFVHFSLILRNFVISMELLCYLDFWETCTWDVHEKIPMALRPLVYSNEMGRRQQFVYFTSDYQSYSKQRLAVKIHFLKQRMIISPI